MLLHSCTIFLSAFLLFQVQPMIAKMILPWFGGTAAVWATCLVFFQTVLLLGYLYAHGLTRRLSRLKQRLLHSVLLLVAALTLPILPDAAWKPVTPDAPALRILGLLAATVGLPYFLLSTTGPLIQVWFVQARPGQSPYRLFALSNLGSMIALLSYPLAVEPNLALHTQGVVWSVGFAVFAVLCAVTGWLARGQSPEMEPPGADEPPAGPSSWSNRIEWIAFACCPSILLLALTAHISMDIAPIPFLWILPLAVYLLSFILCFDAEGWYRRIVFMPSLLPALGCMLWLFQLDHGDRPDARVSILIYLISFFICAMVCHGELARRKPHPSRLTGYYLMISAGGALGGAFVAFVAPAVFSAYYEFPLSIGFCAILACWAAVRVPEWPFGKDLLGWPTIGLSAACALLLGLMSRAMYDEVKDSLLVARNFYGELRVRQYNGVYDWGGYRTLIHGSINHGEQYTHPARRREAVSYYCKETGLGRYMESRIVGSPQRVAVIGLGTGTLAAYSRPGDLFRFYEINPVVERIARQQFTYLNDAEGPVEVVLGDARISLERSEPQGYDLIVLDAFSSDSIPMHLLTVEAMQQYFRHLRPDGVLAAHISNRYLDLEPVLERAASAMRKDIRVVETDDNEDETCYGTTWVMITARGSLFGQKEFTGNEVALPKPSAWLRPWTDDFSSIYRLFK